MPVKVKICCIQNREEIDAVVAGGADAIGLVSGMPSGPGVISDEKIKELAAYARGKTEIFLLSSKTNAAEIIRQYHKVEPDTLQLVDMVEPRGYLLIREALPRVRIVQVLHVCGPEALDQAKKFAGLADALLLDSGNPNQLVKVLGGTGKTHDWGLSREIVRRADIPVYLAGGLNPDNVRQAVTKVRPDGVDLCSGIRTGGMLNKEKFQDFMDEVKAAGIG